MIKRILTDLSAIGLSIVAVASICGCEPSQTPAQSPKKTDGSVKIGGSSVAKDEVQLNILDYPGLQHLIESKRGKVVVLDAWSTGCPPCMKSFPDLVALQGKIGPDRLACISLSLDYEGIGKPEEAVATPLEFLRKQNATFDNVMSSEEPDEIYKKLGIASIPAVFVYDSSGTLRKKFTEGASSKGPPLYAQVEELVNTLLAEGK